MYKWQGEGVGLPGIGAVDLSDEDFIAAQAEYAKGFPDEEPGILERSGLWRYYGREPVEERIEAAETAAKAEG